MLKIQFVRKTRYILCINPAVHALKDRVPYRVIRFLNSIYSVLYAVHFLDF